ncbi:hypothetical protein HMPREF2829_02745 [Aerococcus sp. HMSC072A12]|nr:hypothetical protein HMPREF2829_02745 [Aerococcus sp. HMSC072A12]OFR33345.1 hypothetical protein HMPREF2892_00255 [Aerococcus sp. HMSC061A03]
MLLIEIDRQQKNKIKKVLTSLIDFDILIESLDSEALSRESNDHHLIKKVLKKRISKKFLTSFR